MPDRVSFAEELLDELLIDDSDGRSTQRVLQLEAAAHDNVCADRIEVLRSAFHPGCALVQVLFALNFYARPPIVRLHRSVGGEADFHNTGNGVELIDDGLVERLYLCILVARRLRIDVCDIAVRRI